MRISLRRSLLGIASTALVAGTVVAAPAEAATPQADTAADWLADQLDAGLVVSEYFDGDSWVGYTDYGLTLDFFYAFEGLDVKSGVRMDILDAIEPEVEQYVTPFGTTYAGAIGKLLTAVQAQGIDPATYGDGNLLSRLESQVHTAKDSEEGRAEDAPSDDESDSSNTLGQSFVVQALARADSALADEAVAFLLKQQCDKGYFRVYMESADHTCDAGTSQQSGASVDATAAAMLALLEVMREGNDGVDPEVLDSVLTDATHWLLRKQADNGSFGDEGVANANSTGLAAQALAEMGKPAAAGRAASWLDRLLVTKRLVRRTAFKAGDRGAVAFTKAALDDGRRKGITRADRYQWRRATAQAAIALDSLPQ